MRIRLAVAGVAALLTGLTACGGGAAHRTAGHAAAPDAAGVKVSTSSLGPILTDQNGRTLYAFTNDKNRSSSCSGQCIASWPALAGGRSVTAGAGVDRSLLGETKRAEGTLQATYGAWPLYYYAGDMNAGDVDGQGVDGVWYAVGADGKLVKRG